MNTINIRKYRLYLFLGIMLTLCGLIVIQLTSPNQGYEGFIIGFGSSISAVFLIRLRKNIKHPEEVRQDLIEAEDERNRMVNGVAGYVNVKTTSIILSIQSVIFYFMKLPIPLVISLLALVIHYTSFTLLRNYYDRRM